MSDNNQHTTEQQLEQDFERWLQGEPLSKALEQNEQWMARVQTANYVEHNVQDFQQQNVPNWDRASAFTHEKQPWWQWQGLPALSMAFSCFAIALVIFKVDIHIKDEGMLLSFSGQSQQKIIDDSIDRKLQMFASEQQVVLANYAADIKGKQNENNLQLAQYVLTTSRSERKEDMSDFIQYFNDYQKDQALSQKIRFQTLERAIQGNNEGSIGTINGFGQLQSTPKTQLTTWTSKE